MYVRKITELIKHHEIKLVYYPYDTIQFIKQLTKNHKIQSTKSFHTTNISHVFIIMFVTINLTTTVFYTFSICVYTPISKQQFRKGRSPTLIIIIR